MMKKWKLGSVRCLSEFIHLDLRKTMEQLETAGVPEKI
jgi:pseudouridine-5'-phosphate glycosidase